MFADGTEEQREQDVEAHVEGGSSVVLDLEELMAKGGEEPSQESSDVQEESAHDIADLLEAVYSGMGKARIESEFNVDVAALGLIGDQRSLKGRFDNAERLAANYLSGVQASVPEDLSSVLERIVSAQNTAQAKFETSRKRIESYHWKKHQDSSYTADLDGALLGARGKVAQFQQKLVPAPTPYEPRYTEEVTISFFDPKDEELKTVQFGKPTTQEVRDGMPLLSESKIIPLPLRPEDRAERVVNEHRNEVLSARIPREVGSNVLYNVGIIAAALAIMVSVPAYAVWKTLDIRDNLESHWDFSGSVYIPPTGNLAFATADDPIGNAIEAEMIDQSSIPEPNIEYLTREELDSEFFDITVRKATGSSFGSLVADTPTGRLSAAQFTYLAAVADAADTAYNPIADMAGRVDWAQDRSNLLTVVNIPGPEGSGRDERIVVVAPEEYEGGSPMFHNPDEYVVGDQLGAVHPRTQDSLMTQLDPSWNVVDSTPSFTGLPGGRIQVACFEGGRLKHQTYSQAELRTAQVGGTLLACPTQTSYLGNDPNT